MSIYSPFSLKKENDKALKEWGTVVEALSNGIQTLLIRRRRPAHSEFFLHPTYGIKQTRKCFQKQFLGIYDQAKASKLKGKIEIKCYAQVKEVIEVNDPQRLVDLSDHYIWTSSHVEEYFKESKEKKVYVLILRTFKLPEPKTVDVFPGMSWVNLPEPVSTVNCIPVITDVDFNNKVNRIKAKLEGQKVKVIIKEEDELVDYVLRSTKIIEDNPILTEADTRFLLAEPLLKVLDWDVFNPLEVKREYSIPEVGEHVDIALQIMGNPRIFIETKRWDSGKKLDENMAKQIRKYAKLGDVNWCILTNGNEIRVYNASWKGDMGERLFFKLSLNDYLKNKTKLLLLSKESVEKGELDKAGAAYLTKKCVMEYFKIKKEKIVHNILTWDNSLKKEYVMEFVEELIK